MISCIEPLVFTTLDGAERKFRLTAREECIITTRYTDQLKATARGDFLPFAACLPGVLYVCLIDKDQISEDEFTSILPPDTELHIGFYTALREHFVGLSSKANEKYRPLKAATSSSNGSTSQPSGGPTLVISESSGASDSEKSEQ